MSFPFIEGTDILNLPIEGLELELDRVKEEAKKAKSEISMYRSFIFCTLFICNLRIGVVIRFVFIT
jgi:hypothetical protein